MGGRVLVIGAYGFRNMGTEAILSGILNNIGNHSRVCVLSADPSHTSRLHKVKSVPRLGPKMIYEFMKADRIIIGGDELINDDYYQSIDYDKITYPRLIQGKLIFLMLALSRLFRKKAIVYGLGVGKIKKSSTKYLIQKTMRHIPVKVRDKISYKRLKRLGLDDLDLVVDPASDMTNSKSTSILKKYGLEDKRYIVLTVKNESRLNKRFAAMLKDAEEILTKKYHLVFMIFADSRFNKQEQDRPLIQRLIKGFKKKEKMMVINTDINPYHARQIISGSELVIGMRMHSTIFAALENVPSISIPYNEKHRAVFDNGFESADIKILERIDFGCLKEALK